MQKGKLLRLYSHHFPSRASTVQWADVWIYSTVKPGRMRRILAPTLVGLDDLLDDESMNTKMQWEADPDHSAAKAAFAAGGTHYIGGGPKEMENVYAAEGRISRKTAERLCLAYAHAHGIAASRVKWKRSKVHTIPA